MLIAFGYNLFALKILFGKCFGKENKEEKEEKEASLISAWASGRGPVPSPPLSPYARPSFLPHGPARFRLAARTAQAPSPPFLLLLTAGTQRISG